jgi:ClpP class serine protease
VINASFGFTEAMDKLGVERRVKTAGESKLIADPFSPETDDQKARIERLLNTVHTQFIDLVKARRGEKLKPQKGEALFDGSVFTGTEAIENGIADEIGDLRSVLKLRFGKDTRIKVFSPASQGPLSRLFGVALDGVELRAAWARFGL